MENFNKKQPADYVHPYENMLGDIDKAIRRYTTKENCPPNYILINTSDYEHLATAYRAAGVIPAKAELNIIQSARLIRSDDMPVGSFDVVCN